MRSKTSLERTRVSESFRTQTSFSKHVRETETFSGTVCLFPGIRLVVKVRSHWWSERDEKRPKAFSSLSTNNKRVVHSNAQFMLYDVMRLCSIVPRIDTEIVDFLRWLHVNSMGEKQLRVSNKCSCYPQPSGLACVHCTRTRILNQWVDAAQ